jgi:glyoxylate utilization-related uncharacterized protein
VQALIQILSGRCEFTLAGEPHLLKSGDVLYMPPNLPHSVKATEKFSMLLTLLKPAEVTPIGLNRTQDARGITPSSPLRGEGEAAALTNREARKATCE